MRVREAHVRRPGLAARLSRLAAASAAGAAGSTNLNLEHRTANTKAPAAVTVLRRRKKTKD